MNRNTTAAVMADDANYIAHTYSRAPVVFVRGQGSRLWDADGREYIDCGSGIAVTSFGIADEQWQAAVSAQAAAVQHVSNLYHTAPQARLAAMLCEATGMQKVFFGNSGAEANECAIKAMRKYSSDKYGPGRHTILTLKHSFHGRTLATLAATGQDAFHKHFGPFPEGFDYIEPGDTAALAARLKQGDCCGMLVELVQGESGVRVVDKQWIQVAAQLCRQWDVLFAVDEVQTGNGRTGTLYAWQQYGIRPDLFTTAKGLAGGLPLGACVFAASTADVLGPGDHGSTFGGNPVCAAGAISILERIDAALLEKVKQKGEYLRRRLENAPGIADVSGLGLMLGFSAQKPAAQVAAECRGKGLLVLTAHDRVRLLPALNIPHHLLEQAADILQEVCKP